MKSPASFLAEVESAPVMHVLDGCVPGLAGNSDAIVSGHVDEKSLGLIGNAAGREASADRGLNPRRFRVPLHPLDAPRGAGRA